MDSYLTDQSVVSVCTASDPKGSGISGISLSRGTHKYCLFGKICGISFLVESVFAGISFSAESVFPGNSFSAESVCSGSNPESTVFARKDTQGSYSVIPLLLIEEVSRIFSSARRCCRFSAQRGNVAGFELSEERIFSLS